MKKLLIALVFLISLSAYGQRFRGFEMVPKTTAQITAISSPKESRHEWSSDTNTVWQYNGTAWVNTGVGGGSDGFVTLATLTANTLTLSVQGQADVTFDVSTLPISTAVQTALDAKSDGPHTVDTDTQLNESQVDAFVANNGYSTGAHTVDTDDQTITDFSRSGNVLSITLEDGNTVTLDLTPILAGGGSDDQNITSLTLNGSNILSITIEDGNTITVDLSSLAGGSTTVVDGFGSTSTTDASSINNATDLENRKIDVDPLSPQKPQLWLGTEAELLIAYPGARPSNGVFFTTDGTFVLSLDDLTDVTIAAPVANSNATVTVLGDNDNNGVYEPISWSPPGGGGSPVTSVAGKTGAVILVENDITDLSHTVDTNTQLSDAQVATAATNEGFVTGPHTIDTDTQLDEAAVDAFVANNGYSTGAHTPAADGSETQVNQGTNVTVTGTGTSGDPYVINATGGLFDGGTISQNLVLNNGDTNSSNSIIWETTFGGNDYDLNQDFLNGAFYTTWRNITGSQTRQMLYGLSGLRPGVDDEQDLGSAAARWQDIYSYQYHTPTSNSDDWEITSNTWGESVASLAALTGINEANLFDGEMRQVLFDNTLYTWDANRTTGGFFPDTSDGTGQWFIPNASGGSGATNLSYTASPTNGTITNDTGTDATIPLADGTNAGLIAPAEKTKVANAIIGTGTGRTNPIPISEIYGQTTADYNTDGAAPADHLVVRVDEVTDADEVVYDNATSGLTATDVQAAIDEVAASSAGVTSFNGLTGVVAVTTEDIAEGLGTGSKYVSQAQKDKLDNDVLVRSSPFQYTNGLLITSQTSNYFGYEMKPTSEGRLNFRFYENGSTGTPQNDQAYGISPTGIPNLQSDLTNKEYVDRSMFGEQSYYSALSPENDENRLEDEFLFVNHWQDLLDSQTSSTATDVTVGSFALYVENTGTDLASYSTTDFDETRAGFSYKIGFWAKATSNTMSEFKNWGNVVASPTFYATDTWTYYEETVEATGAIEFRVYPGTTGTPTNEGVRIDDLTVKLVVTPGSGGGSTNASGISVAASPTNYTAASADVEAHLVGVDAALASAGGSSGPFFTENWSFSGFPNRYYATELPYNNNYGSFHTTSPENLDAMDFNSTTGYYQSEARTITRLKFQALSEFDETYKLYIVSKSFPGGVETNTLLYTSPDIVLTSFDPQNFDLTGLSISIGENDRIYFVTLRTASTLGNVTSGINIALSAYE